MELGKGCKKKIPAFIRPIDKVGQIHTPTLPNLAYGYANSSLGIYTKKSLFIFSPTYKTTVFQFAE